MTIYEQIQNAVDYIENHLDEQVRQADVARAAAMSCRSLQKYFWMITGCSYSSYMVQRRMDSAAEMLVSSEMQILEIALAAGYQTHESFTRAFRNAYNVSPHEFRKNHDMIHLSRLKRISLFKEMYMGVIIKELPELLTVSFTGYAPDPEYKAKRKLEQWLAANPGTGKPRRIFGHNIDAQGNPEKNPDNSGYKFYVTLTSPADSANQTEPAVHGETERISAGIFAVTGIEGSLSEDPQGNFIRQGWERMSRMIREKGYRLAENARWFEEELEPSVPGNLRMDLYVELDQDS